MLTAYIRFFGVIFIDSPTYPKIGIHLCMFSLVISRILDSDCVPCSCLNIYKVKMENPIEFKSQALL